MRPALELTDQEAEQASWAGRKRIVDVGSLELTYVEIAGSEPPLLLVHGFTDTSRSFLLLAPHFTGRRLIMPDLRGHGGSQAGEGYRAADFAEDMAGLIQRLRLGRPIVVGHSLGGMVSIMLAARRPELIGGLVILASTLKPDFGSDHQLIDGVAALRDPISPSDPFYDWWHGCRPGVPRAFLAGLAEDASAIPAARWRAILEEVRRTDLTAAARAVQAPTLIIAGGLDPLFGAAHQRTLTDALVGSRLVWAQDCGHNPHWEDPAFVAEAITGMLPAG
ncbi:alpha/beta hydrolase [Mesorhizobium sp. C416B]|uniref:alpha/beta fold hydrolase n=1 Tax=unclassified Mesorhizobium TaxID=325217 RepID=UPI0003CE4D7C|nr:MULTISPECIES: alpha/beta hydrolase [unclassified Mesorhizobium]ESX45639.1 alpha/beta hydrolase [Mesorhizobium sp. LSHC424B00]ESX64561.1 alpha/beta hydrolase [Mesorhizobium sp. LSHC416B00]WJI65253.1 alpha/beta hydrolase [Mesorhizobium sp. C416B]WJI67654.1 alpha/beta hydrolase [Mesorhizobium sp. C399B]